MADAYHKNVKLSLLFQLLYGVAFSVALGPLFDVYLFMLGGGDGELAASSGNATHANITHGEGNELVGKVESISGLIALALVIPIGVIVDKFDRVKLMWLSGVFGLLSSATGVVAILKGSVPMWYVTMVINGVYVQLGNSVVYALFADSVKPDQRPKATSQMGIYANVAQSLGPGLTFLSMFYLGNQWTMPALQSVLMFGMVILNPIACVSMFFFVPAPYESSGEGGEEEEEGPASVKHIKGAAWVPWLAATSDLITCIGAGMTIKYFNLYWKNLWHMSPTQVLAIAAVQPLAIAFFIKLLEKPAEKLGRAQASLCCFFTGVFCFVVLAKVRDVLGGSPSALPIALFFYFIRSGMANAVYPLNKSIMFDFTPSSQRGRWNAIETLSGSVWSGSAFIGGYMADHYSYGFTFLLTAAVYAFACLIYSPLLCIVPRHSPTASGLTSPLMASPGGSPMRLAAAVNYASPSGRKVMTYHSPNA